MWSRKTQPCNPKPGKAIFKPGTAPATVGETIAAYRRRRIRNVRASLGRRKNSRLPAKRIRRISAELKAIASTRNIQRWFAFAMRSICRRPSVPICWLWPDILFSRVCRNWRTSKRVSFRDRFPFYRDTRIQRCLMDVGERVWYVNPLLAPMWGEALGGRDHAECMKSVRGRRTLEFVFDPRFMPVWNGLVQNLERVMDRHVSLFWRAYHLHPQEADMDQVLVEVEVRARISATLARTRRRKRQPSPGGTRLVADPTSTLRTIAFHDLAYHASRR